MSAPRTLKARLGAALLRQVPVSRSRAEVLRAELAALRVWAAYRWLPTWRARARQMRTLRDQYVNVGAGPFPLEGFLNLDVMAMPGGVRWDCRRSLPLADGAARGIRMEHFAEHLEPREELPALLADCHRALVPGGIVRVIVPDLAAYVRAYLTPGLSGFEALAVPIPFPEDLPTRMDVVAFNFHQWHEHQWGYDAESLGLRLERAGFREVRQVAFGQGGDARLAADRAEHAPYSLYMEGRK